MELAWEPYADAVQYWEHRTGDVRPLQSLSHESEMDSVQGQVVQCQQRDGAVKNNSMQILDELPQTNVQDAFDWLISRMDTAKESMSEPEHRSRESTQLKHAERRVTAQPRIPMSKHM